MEVVTASPSMLAWDSLWMQQRWRAARVAWYDHFFIIPHLQIVFLFKRVICSYQPTLTQVTSLQEIDQISQLWKVIVTTIIFSFLARITRKTVEICCWASLKVFAVTLCWGNLLCSTFSTRGSWRFTPVASRFPITTDEFYIVTFSYLATLFAIFSFSGHIFPQTQDET